MDSRRMVGTMNTFTIEIAGRKVAVTAIHEQAQEYCRDYLCGGAPDFSVVIAPADIDREQEISRREAELEGRPAPHFSEGYLEITAIQRKITERLLDFDTILFHGSVIGVDGVCYLFTAKSGTGKSTHTRLWREMLGEKAVMINDDKPFLHMEAGQVTACGTPWNGKHHLGENISMPLKAICILERGEENRIQAITAQEALPMLFQQSHRPRDPRRLGKYLELMDRLTKGVAFYRLYCNMDPQAAQVAYRGMGQ